MSDPVIQNNSGATGTYRPDQHDAAASGHVTPMIIQTLGLDPSMEGLSAEYLIAVAGARLSTIDGQIKEMVSGMNARSEGLDHLRCAQEIIDGFRASHRGQDDATIPMNQDIEIQNPDGTTRTTCLANELGMAGLAPRDFTDSNHNGPAMNNMDSLTNAIQQQVERFQEGAEIQQVRLQQLVSSRGTFVQMCSQLMAAMHETERNINGNIRA